MSTYLYINIAIVSLPLILSFDKKVQFSKKWKYVLPAIAIPGILFILWDVWFTHLGIWSFNPIHLIGLKLFGLPIEEHLFFITVPYASIFTYEVLKCYWPELNPNKVSRIIFGFFVIVLLSVALVFTDRLYTLITFLSLAISLLILLYLIKVKFLGRFLIAYGLIIIPFLIFNGILTGSWLDEPVVIYNNTENLNIRIWTIPFEDTFYGMLLVLLNIFFFELFQNKAQEGYN